MVALDHLARPAKGDRFDHVWIERALREEARFAVLFGVLGDFVFEDGDELAADDFSFLLRVFDLRQLLEKALSRVDGSQRNVEAILESLFDLVRFALAQEAVVDEDALESGPDRLVQEQSHDRAVDPAGERADDALAFHFRADSFDLLLGESAHAEVERDAALFEERFVEFLAARGVGDFGMELDGVEAAFGVGDGAVRRVGGPGDGLEALRRRADLVAVRHPDVEMLVRLHVAERPDRLDDLELRVAVLAVGRAIDGAAEQLGHQLQAVADAEDGDFQVEDLGVDERRAGLLDAERAPGEDDPARSKGADLLHRHRARVDFAVHVQLANAARDQLRVLRTEIEDEDLLGMQVGQVRPSSAGGAL